MIKSLSEWAESLSLWGSIASIVGLFLAIIVVNKVYNYIIRISKIDVEISNEKQENKSFFSLFTFQSNKKG